jgi:hypothetical protein
MYCMSWACKRKKSGGRLYWHHLPKAPHFNDFYKDNSPKPANGGSMINAGKYTVRITAVDADRVAVGGFDVQ